MFMCTEHSTIRDTEVPDYECYSDDGRLLPNNLILIVILLSLFFQISLLLDLNCRE